MLKFRVVLAALFAASLAACAKTAPSAIEPRPVRTVTVEHRADGQIESLTGQIRAQNEVTVAFRLDGRMLERPVHIGNVVNAGQLIARLDAQNQQNALHSSQADLLSSEALLTEAHLTFLRQQELLRRGLTARSDFDGAQQKLKSAQARVQSARAQFRLTQDQVNYTNLSADAPGTVTAVGAEPGEVVRAGQMIVQLAHQGGRDAVFDVPEQLIRTGPRDPLVHIALSNDPTVRASGRVREVASQADTATRTFQVKVGIIDPPEAMRLGATVTGRIELAGPPGVEVPASALTKANGRTAVWIVDPKTQSVSVRSVEVLRYDPATVVISQGLGTGDIVVTAGVQTLHPGQKVRLLSAVP
jgi:RND family efflux transporter MFP subunit